MGVLAAMTDRKDRMPLAVRRAWLLAVLYRMYEERWLLEMRGLAQWNGQAVG